MVLHCSICRMRASHCETFANPNVLCSRVSVRMSPLGPSGCCRQVHGSLLYGCSYPAGADNSLLGCYTQVCNCYIMLYKVKWGNLGQSGHKQSQPQATSIISRLYCLHGGGVWQWQEWLGNLNTTQVTDPVPNYNSVPNSPLYLMT